jgi:hypothetical protein
MGVARQRFLNPGIGERLLAAKLRLLSGSSDRGTSAALSILTGGAVSELPARPSQPATRPALPGLTTVQPARSHYAARTVYLSERHLRAIDRISAAWQQPGQSRRLSRSAVLRRAIEHLLASVEADAAAAAQLAPEPSPLENL